MKKDLKTFPDQCKEAISLSKKIKAFKNIKDVVIAGMGGSAFTGDVIQSLVGDEIEIKVNKDYTLPTHISSKTLVFVISYSGNTEETLNVAKEAKEKGCKIVGISSDGKIEKWCSENDIPFVKVPSGVQPRCALGYLSIPVLKILEKSDLVSNIRIKKMTEELYKKKEEIEKKGKKIADILFNKIPLIYSSQKLNCLSYGWKTRLNENSKIHAFAHQFPELNHNELVGYTNLIGDFYTIIIKDKEDFNRTKKRYDITKEVIEDYDSDCKVIETKGSNLISRIFQTLYLGDWASYYLALKYDVDPEPVDIVEKFKKKLKE